MRAHLHWKPFLLLLVVGAFLSLWASDSWADHVILKSGGRLEGTILEETETSVQIDVPGLGVVAFEKSEVEQIVRQRIRRLPTQTPILLPATPSPTATEVLFPNNGRRPPGFLEYTQPTNTPIIRPYEQQAKPPPKPTDTPRLRREIPPEAPRAPEAPPPEEEEASLFDDEGLFGDEGVEEEAGENPLLKILGNIPSSGCGSIFYTIFIIWLCLRIGPERGHSTLECVLYGLLCGWFGLILCYLEPKKAKIGCASCCILKLLIVIALIVILFAGAAAGLE